MFLEVFSGWQRDTNDFMRFLFYFWSFAKITDIYFVWFIKSFSSGHIIKNEPQTGYLPQSVLMVRTTVLPEVLCQGFLYVIF